MPTYEQQLFNMIGNAVRQTKLSPLNLGGYSTSGGGEGAPPGGFVGYLPQSRVTFDYLEAKVLEIPSGSVSLLDNLNRIRYRLANVEAISSGINVQSDGVTIGSGIKFINFSNDFTVELTDEESVKILLLGSGSTGGLIPSGVYSENLTSQIPAALNHFDLEKSPVISGSIRIMYNGLRQEETEFVVDSDYQGLTTLFSPVAGDTLIADYDVLVEEVIHGVTYSYLESTYYDSEAMDALLEDKSDADHTHPVYSGVNASSLQSYYIDPTAPTDNQFLLFDGALLTYVPTNFTKTIHNQYIFTMEGDVSNDYLGIKPLRIYAQDVGDSATIEEVLCSLAIPATGTSVKVNVLLNGVSIFNEPAYLEIPSGAYTASRTTEFFISSFEKDDYFQFQLVAGNEEASDLTTHIRYTVEI